MIDAIGKMIRRSRMKTVKPFGKSSSDDLRTSIGDINDEVIECLAVAFADVHNVEIVKGNLLDLSCDAIVSPANSFGDMSGGIDKAIDDFSRGEAQRRLREAIAAEFYGELPVGTALIVEIPRCRIPFVVAAPTMRTPGTIAGSINAYLSMRAALVAVKKHNKAAGSKQIRRLAVPGLGTGVGGMCYQRAAEQMRAAFDNVIGELWRDVIHPIQAPYALHRIPRNV